MQHDNGGPQANAREWVRKLAAILQLPAGGHTATDSELVEESAATLEPWELELRATLCKNNSAEAEFLEVFGEDEAAQRALYEAFATAPSGLAFFLEHFCGYSFHKLRDLLDSFDGQPAELRALHDAFNGGG